MNRYFIVTNSVIGERYREFETNREEVRNLYKDFSQKLGIESKSYYVTNRSFYIVPTEKDQETFGKYFCKERNDNGLIRFKANSKVTKEWIKLLKKKNIEIIDRPDPIFEYLGPIFGRYSTQKFEVNNEIYFSVCTESNGIETLRILDGMREIKGSEYHKALEEAEL